jgi:hypothetical protein
MISYPSSASEMAVVDVLGTVGVERRIDPKYDAYNVRPRRLCLGGIEEPKINFEMCAVVICHLILGRS